MRINFPSVFEAAAVMGNPKQTMRVRATRCCSNGDLRSQHLSAFPSDAQSER